MGPRYERRADVAGECSPRTLGPMRRLVLVAVAAIAVAGCSNEPDEPVVVARDVTGITNPTDSVAVTDALGPRRRTRLHHRMDAR